MIIGGLGIFAYFHARKLWREQKNYERSLKMIPLLIHLPPPSDDTDGGSRDNRDVTDETISKAQIVYNIIAATLQKGFKSKFYGQRHFGFEIVGTKGFVYFYASVPISMLDVVQQAVISAYPSARLEEVSEHNIFSPIGKMSGTMGGELSLKDKFAYPIATYQDLKRDALQSVLNALSTLEKEDGAGIQILMRPADPGWRKKASAIASKKKKGGDSKKSGAILQFSKEVLTAAVKAPEGKDNKQEDNKQLSSLEQSIIDAIDDKTRYPGYEVQIRVVASSNISQRAQSIVNNIVASFALFDAPGKNGFKYTPAKDIESFTTAYIMRFFPQENNQNILNAVELATLFHFPDESNIPTSQLERQASKQVDGPRNITNDGNMLGYNLFRGAKKRINLSEEDRRRHIYAVGQTGTGKSTFLENLALQDMLNGNGFAFIDPHGDTVESLMSMVPKERTEDVIYFNPSDMDYPLGLNMFEFDDPDQIDFLIQETIGMLYKLYDPQRQGIIGPRYEHLFRSAAQTVMADPAGGTFIDIPKLFNDDAYVKSKLRHVTDQTIIDFWTKEMPASQRSNEFGEVKSWFVSKFGAFLSNKMMRNIIGQTKSSFNLRDVMDNKKILLVNLSKGRTGELNSKLLGMIFVMKFQAAAMSRANVPESERVDFSLYVDEFQNFSTDSFASILSEARKYRLSLIVANQFTTQLTEEIRDAVFGNIGTIVSFRVGTNDAEFLAKYFAPVFDIHDLQRIPNFNSITRMLIGGVPTQPFSMATLPPLGKPNQQLATALKQLSAAKFGHPRAQVEADIFARLKSPEPTRPAFSNDPFKSPAGPQFGPVAIPKPSGGSFLDDWLAKRQAPVAPAPRSPWGQPKSSFSPAPTPAVQPQSAAASLTVQPAPEPEDTPLAAESATLEVPPKETPKQTEVQKTNEPLTDVKQVKSDKNLPPIGNLQDELVGDDTIYIDQEGNLSRTEEETVPETETPAKSKKK
ncbi:MAG: type IV secretion system DNA-binding domain-containing protein [bacterium]|nr:type IV secretion system DNA-binding domain-containing protein [bacterium]